MLDPLDHPIISLFLAISMGLGAFFGIVLLFYYLTGSNNPYNYKYIDLDGNEGYAQWCNNDSHLNCYTNRSYVQVKEFHKND